MSTKTFPPKAQVVDDLKNAQVFEDPNTPILAVLPEGNIPPHGTVHDLKDTIIEELRSEIAKLRLQNAKLTEGLATANVTISKLQTLVKEDNFIILKGMIPTFTVVVDGVRHVFTDFTFKTVNRLLANKIISSYPNITEVSHEQI